jgi:hypothetical protein
MADEALTFDATSSALDGSTPGSPLNVGPGTSYNLMEHDYPAPPLNVQYASSVDTEGETPVSSRYGNRTISIKFEMVDAAGTLLAALQAKFTKLQREGGTLKRTMKNGDVRIYDIIAGDNWSPVYDLKYYLGDLTEVTMQLPARPFSRGVEVDLGDNIETTLPALVFTDTGVTGDAPGLGRLVIDNDSTDAQGFIVWGIQSRYYSSASTAALFYQAESCAMVSAAVAVGAAGASGAGSNVARNTSLAGGPSSWTGMTYIGASATAQTHVGDFRVFVRVYAPSANTGTVSLRVQYQQIIGGGFTYTDSVALASSGAAVEDNWLLVDLGQITLPVARLGTQSWVGSIQAQSTVAGDDLDLDWIMLVPINEGSGQALNVTTHPAPASGHSQIAYHGAFSAASAGTYWPAMSSYEGDYLKIPPAGAEARTVRVIVKLSRADNALGATVSYPLMYDEGTDDLSARLFVTPRYLT